MSPATDMTDAKAFIAWLDPQPQVNRNRRIGTQGYCMGGPMTFHTASAVPDRVGAVARSTAAASSVKTRPTVRMCWRRRRRRRS